jgi:predicted pyridoxine 5'-phosphate oxidase superfamily flavin-nucleotide-binding protein
LRTFLESGSALILASVDADGAPHASRGWALDVLDDTAVRLLVDGDDARLHDNIAATGVIAITASSVRTLRSVQLKGTATPVEPGDEADFARMQRYFDAFADDVEDTDGVPRSLLARILPTSLAVCHVVVDAVYDQTPGPQAGCELGP